MNHFQNLFSSSVPPLLKIFLTSLTAVSPLRRMKLSGPSPLNKRSSKSFPVLAPLKPLALMGSQLSFTNVVLHSIWDFFKRYHPLKEENHTFIALVPKQLGPFDVNHFRPISLCNIIYKIISKILANRLKPLLHNIISPFQSAFVPTRNIQDNSILARELLHSLKSKRGRGGLMVLKIDIKKAFDRIEWDISPCHYGQVGVPPHLDELGLYLHHFYLLHTNKWQPLGLFTTAWGLRQGVTSPLSFSFLTLNPLKAVFEGRIPWLPQGYQNSQKLLPHSPPPLC